MLDILGDTLAAGIYRFHGGISSDEEELDGDIDEDDEDSLSINPRLRSVTQSVTATRQNSPEPATPCILSTDSAAEYESRSQKRHRESGDIKQSSKKRKSKVSGVIIMEKISDGLLAMAGAVEKSSSYEAISPKRDTVTSSLQGQAQEKIQDEACLNEDGQVVMLGILTDVNIARTYLAIKSSKLRARWIRKQIEEYITQNRGNLDDLWID